MSRLYLICDNSWKKEKKKKWIIIPLLRLLPQFQNISYDERRDFSSTFRTQHLPAKRNPFWRKQFRNSSSNFRRWPLGKPRKTPTHLNAESPLCPEIFLKRLPEKLESRWNKIKVNSLDLSPKCFITSIKSAFVLEISPPAISWRLVWFRKKKIRNSSSGLTSSWRLDVITIVRSATKPHYIKRFLQKLFSKETH